jgi:predicted RNase H-like HicB family nuclease
MRAIKGNNVRVDATWDEEARVWVAESDDVPGLVTEAESLEALLGKLRVLIPELLEENGAWRPPAPLPSLELRTIQQVSLAS